MTCSRPRCRGRMGVQTVRREGEFVVRTRVCDVCGHRGKTAERRPPAPDPRRRSH